MNLNYMQYPAMQQQQYGTNMNRPAYQPNGWNNRIRPVSSIEEVRAASIDFDGSVFYFSDLANKKIYTKQINMDGTSQIYMYELKEIPTVENQAIIDTSNFITRNEFEDAIKQLKNYLAEPAAAGTVVEDRSAQPDVKPKRSFDF